MLNSHHCRSILTRADSNFMRFLRDCFVKKLLTLSLVSEKNEKYWQIIFLWLNQSENRVTFT